MKASFHIILLSCMMSYNFGYSQNFMNIHLKGGTVQKIPINEIDSITYTVGNPGNLATIYTVAAQNIGASSAVCGGNIEADGGSVITDRGICWSTSPNPTTANFKISSGSGPGMFSSTLTNLTLNTTYYVRAFAINAAGTAYGNQIVFTTKCNSGLAGVYNYKAKGWCGSEKTGTLELKLVATGVYLPFLGGGAEPDFSFGSYAVCYGATAQLPGGNLLLNEDCNKLFFTGTSRWGETYEFRDVKVNGPELYLSWKNDYEPESGEVWINRTDGKPWPNLYK
jgi:hypothetical protein